MQLSQRGSALASAAFPMQEAGRISGLTVLRLVFAPSPGPETTSVFSVTFGDGGPIYGGPVRLGPHETVRDIAVHTHLLPDGPLACHIRLRQADDTLLGALHLNTIVHNPSPLAAEVRASLRRRGTPLVIDGPCDTSYYDYTDTTLTPWFDRPDALTHLAALAATGDATPAEAAMLEGFVTNGYLVADELIAPDLLATIGTELDDAVAQKRHGYNWGSSDRIPNLHLTYPGIRALWRHPRILRLLELIYASKPRPCQTLTFIFGSQQDMHQDTIHLTPFPAGYMCGVWVAIDDVQPESGELVVLKGSHRLPRVSMRDAGCPKVTGDDWREFGARVVTRWRALAAASDLEAVTYRPKAGSVLIWHADLMHAGSHRRDPSLSRRSIVSHCFADGAIAFYDSSGMVGTMADPEAA